ncbi:MAG: DUF72 domain-containing protein [Deltaproteobacteria bacterium]|nr:MAG: DUF72 domain-containing protein [Deltaproteobacteria bacterium]
MTQGKERSFIFKGIHPRLAIGTASDRYSGWLGQIYTWERYAGRIKRRTKKVGGCGFVEEILPVDSVREFFEHFDILELDFTFYRPLKDEQGNFTQSYHTLKAYGTFLNPGNRIILKVPQLFFAKRVWRKEVFGENPHYLDADAFARQFYEPALELLDPWLAGLLFEQEYHRKDDRPAPKKVAEELDRFFRAIPSDSRYHVELRTDSFLSPEVFGVFDRHGIGQVLSHWSWLPSLKLQFSLAGRRIFSKSRELIIRLMTPRGMRYEEAYAKAYPFDRLVEGMLQNSMVRDAVDIAREAIKLGVRANIIINNRAGGNAPLIAQKVLAAFTSAFSEAGKMET